MPYLTNLADIARRTGYPVVEVSGWKSRGHGPQPAVEGVVCHHTAGRGDMHIVRDGRPGLDGPLSHFWLKHDGTIYVIASGRCWHNAPSTSAFHTNSSSLGIEAENDGHEPWPAVQLDAYKKLCAEICRAFKLPASRVKGHKEVNTQKVDPHSINMNDFRASVARILQGGDDDVSAKDLWTYELPVPYGSPENPEWQAGNVLVNNGKWLRKISGQLDAQAVTIRTLAEAIARQNTQIDPATLMTQIEAAIERVVARLDVDDAAA